MWPTEAIVAALVAFGTVCLAAGGYVQMVANQRRALERMFQRLEGVESAVEEIQAVLYQKHLMRPKTSAGE